MIPRSPIEFQRFLAKYVCNFFFEDSVLSSNTRSLFSDLNFMRFQFSIFRVRGKKRLLARSIRRRLIVSCSSVRATSAQNRLIYRIGRAAAKRQPTTTEEAAGRKKHTHLIINKRQKGAKDNGNNNLARTHTLVGYNDTSTQHYTLETLAESTPPPIPNPYHTIPTPSHPALYPMPTPEIPSIHHHNNAAVIVVGQPMRSVCRLLRLLPTPLLLPRPHPHPYPKSPSSAFAFASISDSSAADPAQSEFQAHSYVASYIGSSFQ